MSDSINEEHPLFKEKKYNKGWTLNIVKNNDIMLTTSLYDNGNKFIELRAFNLEIKEEIELLKLYIKLFEDNPEDNLQTMLKLKIGKHNE